MDFAYRIQSSLMVPDSYNGNERYHGKTEHVSSRPGRMLHCIKIHHAKLTTHCLLKEIILFKQPNGTFNQNIVFVSIDILVELLCNGHYEQEIKTEQVFLHLHHTRQ